MQQVRQWAGVAAGVVWFRVTQTVKCPGCLALVEIDPRASAHHCGYCGLPFVAGATVQSRVDIETACRQRLDEAETELAARRQEVRQLAAGGRLDEARGAASTVVAIQSQIYRNTGYYGLMGVIGEDAIRRYEHSWWCSELDELVPGWRESAPRAADSSPAAALAIDLHTRFTQSLASQDFAECVGAYRALCSAQMASDPAWEGRLPVERSAAIERAVAALVAQLPWVTPEQARSVGAQKPAGAGRQRVSCEGCGAQVELAELEEQVVCPYCGATTRRTLSRGDSMRAAGLPEEQVHAQLAAERASSGDISALVELASSMLSDDNVDDGHRRALLYYYARVIAPERVEGCDVELRRSLNLGGLRSCRDCGESVALPLDSQPSGCPLCGGRLGTSRGQ
jgi:predicted RNA-binding Zn-ribbon protein involved in translation (DUF1610 family)